MPPRARVRKGVAYDEVASSILPTKSERKDRPRKPSVLAKEVFHGWTTEWDRELDV